MLTDEMTSLLWCPECQQGGLVADCNQRGNELIEGVLRCQQCGMEFEVNQGIPNLTMSSQQDEQSWETWRNHLKGFAARREIRQAAPNEKRSQRWSDKLKAFANFVDAPEGNMLDVGCGPGNLRKLLDPRRVTYFGIDPLPVDGVEEFPFVCGLAESLPFRAGLFSSIVVRSALDHFCDLRAFFEESSRILTQDGRIYLEQVVHGSGGLRGMVKNAVHTMKDVVDDLRTRKQRSSAPKHMREFSQDSLMDSVEGVFDVVRVEHYTSNWYTPTQLFICLGRTTDPVTSKHEASTKTAS